MSVMNTVWFLHLQQDQWSSDPFFVRLRHECEARKNMSGELVVDDAVHESVPLQMRRQWSAGILTICRSCTNTYGKRWPPISSTLSSTVVVRMC